METHNGRSTVFSLMQWLKMPMAAGIGLRQRMAKPLSSRHGLRKNQAALHAGRGSSDYRPFRDAGRFQVARELARRMSGRVLSKNDVRHALFVPGEIEYSTRQDDFCLQLMLQTAAYLLAWNPG